MPAEDPLTEQPAGDHPTPERPVLGRRSLRSMITAAFLVVAGAALLVLLLGLLPDQDQAPTSPTRTPAPVVFPTVDGRN